MKKIEAMETRQGGGEGEGGEDVESDSSEDETVGPPMPPGFKVHVSNIA